jgi:hypothetical protein
MVDLDLEGECASMRAARVSGDAAFADFRYFRRPANFRC